MPESAHDASASLSDEEMEELLKRELPRTLTALQGLESSTKEVVQALQDLNWNLGAISSQLAKMNQLRAKELGIKIVYWDPTVEPWPRHEHREEADLDAPILQGVPKDQRKS